MLATPEHSELRGAMTALRLPGRTNAAKLRRALWERFRVDVVVIERPDQLIIRVSTHFYNTETEVDRLVDTL